MKTKRNLELIKSTVKQFSQNEMIAIKGGNVDDGGEDDGGDDAEAGPGKRIKRCYRRIPPTDGTSA